MYKSELKHQLVIMKIYVTIVMLKMILIPMMMNVMLNVIKIKKKIIQWELIVYGLICLMVKVS